MPLSREMVATFLVDVLDVEGEVKDTTPLFSSSLIDSFQMMTLIEYLEKQGGFRIPPDDVTLENLDSIEKILIYCGQRTG